MPEQLGGLVRKHRAPESPTAESMSGVRDTGREPLLSSRGGQGRERHRSSVLARGDDGSPMLTEKGRSRARLRAATDQELQAELAERARFDESLRRDVAATMRAIGKGRRGQKRRPGEAENVRAAFEHALHEMRQAGERPTLQAAAEWLTAGQFKGRSPEALIKLYRATGKK